MASNQFTIFLKKIQSETALIGDNELALGEKKDLLPLMTATYLCKKQKEWHSQNMESFLT